MQVCTRLYNASMKKKPSKPTRGPRIQHFTAADLAEIKTSLDELSQDMASLADGVKKNAPDAVFKIDGGVNLYYAMHWIAKLHHDILGQRKRLTLPKAGGVDPTGKVPPLPPRGNGALPSRGDSHQ